jgi:integrase
MSSALHTPENRRWPNPDRFTRAFTSAARRAGVTPIRLHDFRHTWATLALQAGTNVCTSALHGPSAPSLAKVRLRIRAVNLELPCRDDSARRAIPA